MPSNLKTISQATLRDIKMKIELARGSLDNPILVVFLNKTQSLTKIDRVRNHPYLKALKEIRVPYNAQSITDFGGMR